MRLRPTRVEKLEREGKKKCFNFVIHLEKGKGKGKKNEIGNK